MTNLDVSNIGDRVERPRRPIERYSEMTRSLLGLSMHYKCYEQCEKSRELARSHGSTFYRSPRQISAARAGCSIVRPI